MNPDQAWQSILGQLQMEMPRASFDTWVRDTKALSLEDGMLTVGVRNAYARDWLESRLESTVNRLLVGILGMGNIRVQFVVGDELEEEQIGSSTEAEDKPEEKTVEVTLTDYDSVYEQVVRPNRAVYLKGYFRRWLKYLGPDLGWLYVAFRQSAYIAGSRSGRTINRISGKRIASLAGCTERTYWNRFERPETWEKLKGLVKIADHGPEWDKTSSTPKRLQRRYAISMTMPLTPRDANSLSRWFSTNIEQHGGPEGVLRVAAEAPLDELIPQDATDTGDPVTVTKLVHELFGGGDLPKELLDSLASAIQNHIMPEGDVIVITEYFLRHILPHIGAGQGWMLTLLRDMCFVDTETGESRNRVTVKGGYAEIADWLGMSRPRTIWDWLNEKYPPKHAEAGKYKNPITRIYVNEIVKDEPMLDFEGQSRTFEVLLEEIPQEFLEIAVTNPNDAIFSIAMTRFSEAVDALFSIGMTRFSYPDDALFSIGLTRFSESIDATFRVLSSLTLKTNSYNSFKTTTTSSDTENEKRDSPDTVVAVDVSSLPSAWGLDWFFKINKTSQKMKTMLHEAGATGNALVSWMLYACSTDPASKKLDDPYGFALSQLIEYPEEGKNENFDKLADLPPRVLVGMLSGTDFNNPLAWLFESLMIDPARNDWSGTPRYRAILPILLGGKAVREPTRKVETFTIKQIVHSK